jgi:cytochrome c peroxidase
MYMNQRNALMLWVAVCTVLGFSQCANDVTDVAEPTYEAVQSTFSNKLDLSKLPNYANQTVPSYITKDNTGNNVITDAGATLGRVLFYDKKLSSNDMISCASCHKQGLAFGDTAIASIGVNGTTGRHSMRLVNSRFSAERRFFWDERAATLEIQTTMPIKDHGEMGYSGLNGDPSFQDLVVKLGGYNYYKELFKFVYGTDAITETRIQNALAQFVRSIQSFDSKYDAGRAQVNNDNAAFPNFTAQENTGKSLFMSPPIFGPNGQRIGGGLGCQGCHRAPEFDIDPQSGNNGIIGSFSGTFDVNNTKAPSLRNLVNYDGIVNSPMMHTGVIPDLQTAIGHYGSITAAPNNTRLDPRLRPGGVGQSLNLNAQEVNSVVAFLKTLSGKDVYFNEKWADPF